LAFERTLVHIRERSFLDLLDLALVVIRRRPVTLGVAALLGCLPFALLNSWLATFNEFNPYLYVVILAWEAPWATAILTVVIGGLMFGERPSVAQVLRSLLRGFVPMLLFQGFVRFLLVFFAVLSPLIPTRLAFLNEVILLERGSWGSAISRTGVLCTDRAAELFARALAQLFFGILFVFAFWFASGQFSRLLLGGWSWDELTWPSLYDWQTQLGVWLVISFFGVARFLTYIDQRIRLEGWEVELRLRQVGVALEDTGAW
jgi:hypothetical protein